MKTVEKVFSEEWLKSLQCRYPTTIPPHRWPHHYFIAQSFLFNGVCQRLDQLVSNLPEDSRNNILPRLRSEQFRHTYNELNVGAALNALGLQTTYEKNFQPLTPDWYVETADGSCEFVVEVLTHNIPDSRRQEDARLGDLTNKIRKLSFDVVLTITPTARIQAPMLTSGRINTICAQVEQWLAAPATGPGAELPFPEVSFCVRLCGLGLSNVQYGYRVEPGFELAALRRHIELKVSKYRQLSESNNLPLVVAVVAGHEIQHEFGDLEMRDALLEPGRGLFSPDKKPMLSGVLFAVWHGLNQLRIRYYANRNARFPLRDGIFPEDQTVSFA